MDWKDRQNRDPFVKKRQENNLLSRAFFKLEEIDKTFGVIHKNDVVLELGAAPGGWTQYLMKKVAKIYAYDLLPLQITAPNIIFRQVSIFDIEIPDKCSLLLSDMAPNFSGNSTVDKLAMEALFDPIFQWRNYLKGVKLVCKIFEPNINDILRHKNLFKYYKFFKPEASRKESQEIYLIAQFK